MPEIHSFNWIPGKCICLYETHKILLSSHWQLPGVVPSDLHGHLHRSSATLLNTKISILVLLNMVVVLEAPLQGFDRSLKNDNTTVSY